MHARVVPVTRVSTAYCRDLQQQWNERITYSGQITGGYVQNSPPVPSDAVCPWIGAHPDPAASGSSNVRSLALLLWLILLENRDEINVVDRCSIEWCLTGCMYLHYLAYSRWRVGINKGVNLSIYLTHLSHHSPLSPLSLPLSLNFYVISHHSLFHIKIMETYKKLYKIKNECYHKVLTMCQNCFNLNVNFNRNIIQNIHNYFCPI